MSLEQRVGFLWGRITLDTYLAWKPGASVKDSIEDFLKYWDNLTSEVGPISLPEAQFEVGLRAGVNLDHETRKRIREKLEKLLSYSDLCEVQVKFRTSQKKYPKSVYEI